MSEPERKQIIGTLKTHRKTRNYQSFKLCILPKPSHHRDFQMSTSPVIVVDALKNVVQSLRHKRPEIIDRAEVKNLIWCMHRPMVIWCHVAFTVDLDSIIS